MTNTLTALRYANGNTGINRDTLISFIRDPNIEKVILFASSSDTSAGYNLHTDGPETNLPLLSALALGKIGGAIPIAVIFDGNFLNAARKPRYLEVRDVLDVAIENPKVFYSNRQACFTSSMPPDDALNALQKIGQSIQLSAANRKTFFSLLCNVTEKEYETL